MANNSTIDSVSKQSTITTVKSVPEEGTSKTDKNKSKDRIEDISAKLNNDSPQEQTLKSALVDSAKLERSTADIAYALYDNQIGFDQAQLAGINARINSAQGKAEASSSGGEVLNGINEENGNAVFTTKGGFEIETDVNQGGHTTIIRNSEGKDLMKVHGDPHVDMGNDGSDEFHFGDDSTLVLNDGTEILFNTEETEEGNGIYFTEGIYVTSGDQTMQTGLALESERGGERNAGITEISNFQSPVSGADEDGALVFGLTEDNQAVINDQETGAWNEIEDETFDEYLESRTFQDQKGAEVAFKPAESTGFKTQASGSGASSADVSALENEKAKILSNIAKNTTLRSMAEQEALAANARVEEYSKLSENEVAQNAPKIQDKVDESVKKSEERNIKMIQNLVQKDFFDDQSFEESGLNISGVFNDAKPGGGLDQAEGFNAALMQLLNFTEGFEVDEALLEDNLAENETFKPSAATGQKTGDGVTDNPASTPELSKDAPKSKGEANGRVITESTLLNGDEDKVLDRISQAPITADNVKIGDKPKQTTAKADPTQPKYFEAGATIDPYYTVGGDNGAAAAKPLASSGKTILEMQPGRSDTPDPATERANQGTSIADQQYTTDTTRQRGTGISGQQYDATTTRSRGTGISGQQLDNVGTRQKPTGISGEQLDNVGTRQKPTGISGQQLDNVGARQKPTNISGQQIDNVETRQGGTGVSNLQIGAEDAINFGQKNFYGKS
jgi:hypothetical protein